MLRKVLIAGGALLGFVSISCAARAEAAATPPARQPNIVFIMADDLGNADLGYRGSEIKTPNIDKLANEGVRLESFYGQQVCTPSRAALMTGRYPMRYGLQTLVIFPSHTYGLPTDERTLPQALKDAGYKTLMVGKWHLGHADKKYWPQNRGFDYFYGNVMGEIDYFTRERGGIIDWQRNGEFVKENGYYTTLIGDEAVKLSTSRTARRPSSSTSPRSRRMRPTRRRRTTSIATQHRRQAATRLCGMITALDDQIGRIVAELDKKGLRDNTIILLASDNGGATSGLFASGRRARRSASRGGGIEQRGKGAGVQCAVQRWQGSLYEGGVRVPAFVNWPGRLKPASSTRRSYGRCHADAAGSVWWQGQSDHPFDGKDMWAVPRRRRHLAATRIY